MSSFVGTGVAKTVVFMVAVETGPTNKFQRFSRSITMDEEKAAGFATAVPFRVVERAGVGMIEDVVLEVEVTP